MNFFDGTGVTPGTEGCKCGPSCEFPCWQRLGLTTDPCCDTCAPLVSDDAEDLDRQEVTSVEVITWRCIRCEQLALERDHFRRALIRIGNNESGHWGVIAREALKTAANSQEGQG